MKVPPTPDRARRSPGRGRQRFARRRAAGFSAALLLTLSACGTAQSEPAPEETPPLHEPTAGTPSDDAEAQTDATAQPGPETQGPETEGLDTETPDTEEDSDEDPQESEFEEIDASEFSSEPQQSTGFPDMLTEFPEDGEELLLTDVRVGQHEGYDRIVFEHSGDGAPGWHAEYVEEAVEPGSGFPIEVEAGAILYLSAVGLVPGNAGPEQGHLEVSNWTDQTETIFEDVVTTFVHHGAASYYVGLDQERDFRVSVWEHEDGPRLIIDVLH